MSEESSVVLAGTTIRGALSIKFSLILDVLFSLMTLAWEGRDNSFGHVHVVQAGATIIVDSHNHIAVQRQRKLARIISLHYRLFRVKKVTTRLVGTIVVNIALNQRL